MDKISARNSIIQVLMESHVHKQKIQYSGYKSRTEDRKTKPKQTFSLLTKTDRMAIELQSNQAKSNLTVGDVPSLVIALKQENK